LDLNADCSGFFEAAGHGVARDLDATGPAVLGNEFMLLPSKREFKRSKNENPLVESRQKLLAVDLNEIV
jgi:hypothetical protein